MTVLLAFLIPAAAVAGWLARTRYDARLREDRRWLEDEAWTRSDAADELATRLEQIERGTP